MDEPKDTHFQAAKKIVQYLKGTLDFGLFFPSNNHDDFHTYVDADWGRDIDSRKSTSGILHKMGGACIAWSSKLQPTVSLSSTEAEYRVLTTQQNTSSISKDYYKKLALKTQNRHTSSVTTNHASNYLIILLCTQEPNT